ncbi:MAG: Clp protease ClpC, partial [Flavobacteriales bacterium]|nr:Clp protease ClpC [Flavobacteriales bacterium]
MEENFSTNIKDVIGFSREEALRLSNNSIGTEHFILGIIKLGNAGAIDILHDLGIKIQDLQKDVEMFATNKVINNTNTTKNQIPLKKEAEKALRTTFLEARVFNSSMVGTTHLLLCILRNDEDMTTKFLNSYNITYDRVKEAFINQLETQDKSKDNNIRSTILPDDEDTPQAGKSEKPDSHHKRKSKTKSNTPVLDNFGRD